MPFATVTPASSRGILRAGIVCDFSGMKKDTKSCMKCGSTNLKCEITTYPLSFEGKQPNVGRVSVRKCLDCSAIVPTEAGKAKLNRATMMYFTLLAR